MPIGVAWLTLDRPDTSANILSAARAARNLHRSLADIERAAPRGLVLRSGKEVRLHRRRRHQGIHDAAIRDEALAH